MFETLKARLTAARHAVSQAEADVEEVTERSPERLARQHLDLRKSDLAAAEFALKLHELAELDTKITAALKEKVSLHARIKRQLESLVPDLQELDELELTGKADSDRAFTIQGDLHQPLAMRWRDPKLPNVVGTVRAWAKRLEG